jgi:uncharacterized membrane protein
MVAAAHRSCWVTAGVALAFAYFYLPTYRAYDAMLFAWHDIGMYFQCLNNLFDLGDLYLYSDWQCFGCDIDTWRIMQVHFVPFFYVLAPLVRLSGLLGLATLQCGALAVATYYLFRFAERVCNSTVAAALVATAFVCNPYTLSIDLSYHWEPLAMAALMAFAYYNFVGRSYLALVSFIIALSIKEDVWLYAVLAAITTVRRERSRQGLLFAALAVAYYVVVLRFLYPLLEPQRIRTETFLRFPSAAAALQAIGADPVDFLQIFVRQSGADFLGSVAYLPLLAGWRGPVALVPLAIWTYLPAKEVRRLLYFYYSWPCLTLAYLSLPFAARSIGRLAARATCLVPLLALAAALASAYQPPRVLESGWWTIVSTSPTERSRTLRALIAKYLADPREAVVTQFSLMPYVPPRPQKYLANYAATDLMVGKFHAAWIFLDVQGKDPYFAAADKESFIDWVRSSGRYSPVVDNDDIFLYRALQVYDQKD